MESASSFQAIQKFKKQILMQKKKPTRLTIPTQWSFSEDALNNVVEDKADTDWEKLD